MGMPYCNTSLNIKEAAIKAIHENHTFYTSNFGITELRSAIADEYNKTHVVKVNFGNVLVTNGVAQALFLSMFSILDEGDEVLVPDPGYVGYYINGNMMKGKIIYYPLSIENEFGIIADDIISRITDKTKLICLNSPSNPTGGINSDEELNKLADYCQSREIFIISDEVYSNLNYSGKQLPSISNHISLDKLLVLNGISKEFAMTGWRIGWIITSTENVKQLLKGHQVMASCACSISQYAALEAVRSKNDEVIKSLAHNREVMKEGLKKIKNIRYCIPKGGMYFFADFSHYGDDMELAIKLIDHTNVVTIPGTAFGKLGAGFLRLSYGTTPEDIAKGLELIQRFLESQ
jgi:aspartate/methionine/tyrosine aminotransferase